MPHEGRGEAINLVHSRRWAWIDKEIKNGPPLALQFYTYCTGVSSLTCVSIISSKPSMKSGLGGGPVERPSRSEEKVEEG